jgi:hypothetical protein
MVEMTQERRRHPRIELVATAEVAASEVPHLLHVLNASRGGVFLKAKPENYPDFHPGSEIKLHLFPGSDQDIADVRAVGKIVRIENDGTCVEGFAVEFTDVDDRGALDRLLEQGT